MIQVLAAGQTYEASSCVLGVPRIGAWVAHVSLSEAAALEGLVTLRLGGLDWVASVVSSGSVVGFTQLRLVAAAGLLKSVESRYYQRVGSRFVLAETLAEVGERLSSASSVPGSLRAWARAREQAGSAVGRLVEHEGLSWRVQRNGEVWVGTETWPDTEATDVTLIDGSAARGIFTVALDTPTLLPGTVWAGRRVERVVMTFEGSANRTKVFV